MQELDGAVESISQILGVEAQQAPEERQREHDDTVEDVRVAGDAGARSVDGALPLRHRTDDVRRRRRHQH